MDERKKSRQLYMYMYMNMFECMCVKCECECVCVHVEGREKSQCLRKREVKWDCTENNRQQQRNQNESGTHDMNVMLQFSYSMQ